MPAHKRKRRERTHEWQDIQQATLWPEQEVYERLRPKSRLGNIPTQNVDNELVIHLVVLRENTYPYHFFDERNVDHESTTSTPSQR
jgi:predicted nucleotidyltransferase